jgi:hypothetical protein
MYSIIWKGELPKRMTIFYLTIGRIAKETHKISHRMDKTAEKLLDLQPQRNRRARATSSMIEANQAEDAQHQKKSTALLAQMSRKMRNRLRVPQDNNSEFAIVTAGPE